jgi:preprotein translocase subunit SecE
MAVGDIEKVEKAEKVEKSAKADRSEKTEKTARKSKGGDGGDSPGGLTEAVTWLPRKLKELRTFFSEVRAELKKVTWPSRKEVYSTTIVVIMTTFFFGFYLWGLDLGLTQVLSRFLRVR